MFIQLERHVAHEVLDEDRVLIGALGHGFFVRPLTLPKEQNDLLVQVQASIGTAVIDLVTLELPGTMDLRGMAARPQSVGDSDALSRSLAIPPGETAVVQILVFKGSTPFAGRDVAFLLNPLHGGSIARVVGTELRNPDFAALAQRQKERLAQVRARRDQARVAATLEGVRTAAAGAGPMMEPIIEAVRARATLGEVSDALRAVWGTYDARG